MMVVEPRHDPLARAATMKTYTLIIFLFVSVLLFSSGRFLPSRARTYMIANLANYLLLEGLISIRLIRH